VTSPGIAKYRYTETNGAHVPYISVRLRNLETNRTAGYEQSFIVDSGCSYSLAPRAIAGDLFEFQGKNPVPVGRAVDAKGNLIVGIPIRVGLVIKALDEVVEETVYFCEDVCHKLLGNSTFFEQFLVEFKNPPSIRRFTIKRFRSS